MTGFDFAGRQAGWFGSTHDLDRDGMTALGMRHGYTPERAETSPPSVSLPMLLAFLCGDLLPSVLRVLPLLRLLGMYFHVWLPCLLFPTPVSTSLHVHFLLPRAGLFSLVAFNMLMVSILPNVSSLCMPSTLHCTHCHALFSCFALPLILSFFSLPCLLPHPLPRLLPSPFPTQHTSTTYPLPTITPA